MKRRAARAASGAEASHLELGRASSASRAWADTHRHLSLADRASPLKSDDLELLALSAYLVGRDDDYLRSLERAFHAHRKSRRRTRAVRCAFWLGLGLLLRGEGGRASGWLARGHRLLEREKRLCAEQGYLLLPQAERLLGAGDSEKANSVATKAAEIGERCAEPDLVACARHLQGRSRLCQGRIAEGLALLDEAMLAAGSGELSPIMTGLVYCSVIEAFQQVHALDRAREWTSALSTWCAQQPQMVAFNGACRVHRAEIMRLGGAWQEAIEEARRARERAEGLNRQATAAAYYQQGEALRLLGEFAAAEEAYRSASRFGMEPYPGLALLRLAQGRSSGSAAALRRALGTTSNPLARSRLLPAYVETMVAVGDPESATGAAAELERIADQVGAETLRAAAAYARGSIELARNEAQNALISLRQAAALWQSADVPYEVARSRRSIGLACRSIGDEESGRLELEAANAIFEKLGAAPDIARTRTRSAAGAGTPQALTRRELEVLRLVANGKTNKAIAARLVLSERTVDRHVSNILSKLDVPSRAAATAFAYQHQML